MHKSIREAEVATVCASQAGHFGYATFEGNSLLNLPCMAQEVSCCVCCLLAQLSPPQAVHWVKPGVHGVLGRDRNAYRERCRKTDGVWRVASITGRTSNPGPKKMWSSLTCQDLVPPTHARPWEWQFDYVMLREFSAFQT